jgi:S1-C subfamily serine protease
VLLRKRSSLVALAAAAGLWLVPAGSAAGDPGEPDRRAWLGVFLEDAVDGGVELVALVPGGPAERAGLCRGDVVVRAGTAIVATTDDLRGVLRGSAPGRELPVQVLRAGGRRDVPVTLGAWPAVVAPSPPPAVAAPRVAPGVHAAAEVGLTLADVTPDLRAHFGAPAGAGVLITAVAPGRAAAAAGFQVGDILVRLGDQPVGRVLDAERVLVHRDPAAPLPASLVRAGETAHVHLLGPSGAAPPDDASPAPDEVPGPGAAASAAALSEAIEAEIERLRERIRQLERELDDLGRRAP